MMSVGCSSNFFIVPNGAICCVADYNTNHTQSHTQLGEIA